MVERSYRLKGNQLLLERASKELGYVREIEGAYYAVNIIEENRLFLQAAGITARSVRPTDAADNRRLRNLNGV